MGSNYKILNNLDLSRNDLINVSRILGYELSSLGNDLEITTADTTTSGDTILRAGAGNNPGKVHIFSGVIPTWSNGTVSDEIKLRGGVPRGITLNPDSSISLIGDESSITLDSATSISLRASSDGSTTASNKNSIVLTSEDDKVAIKDTLFSLESSDNTTVETSDLTTVTSDKFKISSTSGKYTLEVNSTSKPSTSINGTTSSYRSLLKIEAVDASEKINAQKDVEIAGNISVKNTSSSFSKNANFEVNNWNLEGNNISLKYHGNDTSKPNFLLESNSNEHKLIIDNIDINEDVNLNNFSAEGDFSISNSGAEYVSIETPTYINNTSESFELKAGSTTAPTLAIEADTTHSSINIDDISVDNKVTINNPSKDTKSNPAFEVNGASTLEGDTFIKGRLVLDTTNGLITSDQDVITIEEETVNIKSTTAEISGSQIDIKSSDNLNITATGSSANLVIRSSVTEGSTSSGLAIIADSTTSSITVDSLAVRGNQTFSGTTFSTSVSSRATINAPEIGIDGTQSIRINGTTNSGLSIQGTTNNSSISVKNLAVATSADIQNLQVEEDTTLAGNVNINGDINLTGNGLITSTATTKNIQIQADDVLDIRRTPSGSTSNSVIYADRDSTYINASHINLTTDLTFGKDANYPSGKVHLTSTSASISIPTSIVANTTSAALNIQNTSGAALIASGNASINEVGSYTTTVNGSTLNLGTAGTYINIGTTTASSVINMKGSNDLIIKSNNASDHSLVQATDVKVNSTLIVNGYSIYYDRDTNSIVFAQGNI